MPPTGMSSEVSGLERQRQARKDSLNNSFMSTQLTRHPLLVRYRGGRERRWMGPWLQKGNHDAHSWCVRLEDLECRLQIGS